MTPDHDPLGAAADDQRPERPSPFPHPAYEQPQDVVAPAGQPFDVTQSAPHTGDAAGSPGRNNRGKLVAAAAAVVVIGGGVATYAAVSSSSTAGGAATPRAAVNGFVTDLNNADFVGMLGDLPPGERSAISKPLLDTVGALKRNDVVRPGADLSRVSGFSVAAKNLTYGASTIAINDHVQIVQLTGGTLRIGADARKLPLTADFLRAVGADEVPGSATQSTVDIGQQVRRTGRPIRIATQQVDGRWYPSLMYTIADNAVTSQHLTAPTPAQRIPAIGATSPDAAVRSFVDALLSANLERAGELLSPDELAVLHDYGRLVVDRSHYAAPPVRIEKMTFKDTPISGGTRVSLRSIRLTADGKRISASVNGSCVTMTMDGRSQHVCAGQTLFPAAGFGTKSLTARQRTALSHLLSGNAATGLDVTTSAGRYYISPVRTVLEFGNDLLSGLKAGDGKVLLGMLHG